MKAHWLIDSGCKGIMISLSFIIAAKSEAFPLDKPIGIQLAVTGSKSVINYGVNMTIKYNEKESKEYFDIVNIDYYDVILGMLFLKKHEVIIDFLNNCLRIKDRIIHNQANKYKVVEGNPQKNKKNISMKALKQVEPKIPQEGSNSLSKESHSERSDRKDSANCLTQKSVGLKKEMSGYTHSDIPQLHEEIAEKYSKLLGLLLLKLLPICVSHEISLIDESKQLKHRLCRVHICSS